MPRRRLSNEIERRVEGGEGGEGRAEGGEEVERDRRRRKRRRKKRWQKTDRRIFSSKRCREIERGSYVLKSAG